MAQRHSASRGAVEGEVEAREAELTKAPVEMGVRMGQTRFQEEKACEAGL